MVGLAEAVVIGAALGAIVASLAENTITRSSGPPATGRRLPGELMRDSARPTEVKTAASDSTPQSVRTLQSDVDALRSEVHHLRDELAALNRELADARLYHCVGDRNVDVERPSPDDVPHGRRQLTDWRSRPVRISGWATALSPRRDAIAAVIANAVAEPWRALRSRVDAIGTSMARVRAVEDSATRPAALGRRWELAMVVAIVLIAAFLRFDQLTISPPGFHGDEGVWGLESQRILRDGWIGPYVSSTAGTPTGTMYLSALSVWLFDNTIFAVRAVPALMSTLTVFAVFVLLRRNLGVQVALTGCAFLAVMSWHVHFSRIGYSVGTWLFFVVLGAVALMEAVRRNDWRWWVATGALLGVGVYTYNAHPLFIGIVLAFALYHVYRWYVLAPVVGLLLYVVSSNPLTLTVLVLAVVGMLLSTGPAGRWRFVPIATIVIALLILSLPMIRYAADPNSGYFNRFRSESVLTKDGLASLDGPVETLGFVAGRYVHFWERVCCQAEPDGIDATGVTALVPKTMLLLAIAGGVLGLSLRGGPLVVFGLLVVLVMPIGAALTEGVAMRRSLAIVPFLAMFAAIGLVELLRLTRHLPALKRSAAVTILAFVVSLAVYGNLTSADATMRAPEARRVFAQEFADAVEYMRTLPEDSHVYLFSDQWYFDHPTRAFLAQNVTGEDRSNQFGPGGFGFYDITAAKGRPVLIFVDAYLDSVDEAIQRYPGGETTIGRMDAGVTFVAYLVPVGQ